ncbi:MAG TPA: MarR family transcriptional regulator [Mycobacteriales bacterium]|nr:MarR family transcriptional regulator [Mycobacteriales bacterium]
MAEPSFDQRTGHLLIRLGRRLESGVAAATAPHDLRPRHVHVLALAAENPLSQRELSQRSGYDRTTMVAVVDELEDRGLVTRNRGERDRRRFFVVPTEEGRRTHAAMMQDVTASENALFGALSRADRGRLDDLLTRLLTADNADQGPSS